ncbi:MAG: glycosyltransferase family 1 protein, partial [Chloroflexota bacterium]|nr:glycosyltransferase family 1 protein [Chloroflexota bacterium]
PITDVAEPYGDIVYLGRSHDEFIAACEQALAATPEERERRARIMREVLKQTSWDRTVTSIEALIDEAVADCRLRQVEEMVG